MSDAGPGGDGASGPRRPQQELATWVVLGTAAVLVGALFGVSCEHSPETTRAYPPRPMPPDAAAVLLPAPEPDDEYYPCSDCHEDEERNLRPRELEDEHDELELAHGDLWCLSCHDVDEPDSLHLADGTTLPFGDASRLCGQCHADKTDDWRVGVHGKRTGHWRGQKEYSACVTCHAPHAPRFAALAPDPPPRRPAPASGPPAPAEDSHERP